MSEDVKCTFYQKNSVMQLLKVHQLPAIVDCVCVMTILDERPTAMALKCMLGYLPLSKHHSPGSIMHKHKSVMQTPVSFPA